MAKLGDFEDDITSEAVLGLFESIFDVAEPHFDSGLAGLNWILLPETLFSIRSNRL